MFHSIKSVEDINNFIEKTNSLHDGYVVGVKYTNNGISKIEGGHYLEPDKSRLVLQVLVTSIWDAVVEIEFENLFAWQIKDCQFCDILDTSVFFNEENQIVWMDDVYTTVDDMKKASYVIAGSMKWRIAE